MQKNVFADPGSKHNICSIKSVSNSGHWTFRQWTLDFMVVSRGFRPLSKKSNIHCLKILNSDGSNSS